MIYDFSVRSFWLLLALALGLVVGWASWSAQARSWSVMGLSAAAIIVLLGVLLAARQSFEGRFAFYIETLLLMSAIYTLGLLLGDVARTSLPPRARHRGADAKTAG